MNYLKKYCDYLKDNPEGYWFKRKPFGWGWTPANWKGFAVTGLFVLIILVLAMRIPATAAIEVVIKEVVIPIVVLSIILIFIAWRTGEKPKWLWHIPEVRKEEDAPDT